MEHFLPSDLFLCPKCCRIPSSGVLLLFDAEQHYSAMDVTEDMKLVRAASVSVSTERYDAAAGEAALFCASFLYYTCTSIYLSFSSICPFLLYQNQKFADKTVTKFEEDIIEREQYGNINGPAMG